MTTPERRMHLFKQETIAARKVVESVGDNIRVTNDLIALMIRLCKSDFDAYNEYTNQDGSKDEGLLEKVELMVRLVPLLREEKKVLFNELREWRDRSRWLERQTNQAQKNLLSSMKQGSKPNSGESSNLSQT